MYDSEADDECEDEELTQRLQDFESHLATLASSAPYRVTQLEPPDPVA
jgi:hypothetical protein